MPLTGQEPIPRSGVAFNERATGHGPRIMSWVLFALLAFLVFGIPLIDEVYRYRARRGRVK